MPSFNELVGPLSGGFFAFAIAVLGWIWNLSGRTAALDYLERRIDALEKSSIARDQRINEMAERLARIEALMTSLVDHFRKAA